jgi:hypothetical protein
VTRVLRSTIAPQPAPGSIVADTDGTAWTRHLHGDVDRWYGCAPTDCGRPTMLARTWETLAGAGDLTVLHEPATHPYPSTAELLRARELIFDGYGVARGDSLTLTRAAA